METIEKTTISVQTEINAPIEIVWKCWTSPESIVKWNYASDDWHTPRAENDLRPDGRFSCRMEAKDGSMGFDFWGTYEKIIVNKQIDSILGDGRKVKVVFSSEGNKTHIAETFEAESSNSIELQRGGWQSILNNFKKYVEAH